MVRSHPPRGRILRSDRRSRPAAAGALAAAAGLALLGAAALPAAAGPSPQRTVRVRAASKGQPDGPSANARISGNGRFVAFQTKATNLGPADPNGHVGDVYLYDDKSAQIQLLSAAPAGGGADGPSSDPAVSADGGTVAFYSLAANLVPRANNVVPGASAHGDVFVWTAGGGLQQASLSSTQVPADGDSAQPDVSADGRFVVFSSTAGNLAAGVPAGQRDVYLRDLTTGTTALLSAASDGGPADGDSSAPAISPDGHFVSFATTATNLVSGTTTSGPNVVVRDLTAGTTRLATVNGAGGQQAGEPAAAAPPVSDVSTGGRFVVFESAATNLVAGDTNHHTDVFVRDMTAKKTVRASLATTDQQADDDSSTPTISPDGHYVTFLSRAPNLTPNQPAGENVFLRDLVRHTTVLVDASSAGHARGPEQSGDATQVASSSDDGSAAVFVSSARGLVGDKRSKTDDVFLRRLTPAPIAVAVTRAGLQLGHVVITFVSVDRQAGPLLCRLDHKIRAICPLSGVVLPLLSPGTHTLVAYAGGPGSVYASHPTRVRIVLKRGGRAKVKVTNPGSSLGIG